MDTREKPVPIARIITRLNVGGPSIQAVTLSDRLASAGFETLLIHGRIGDREGDMRYIIPVGRFKTAYVSSLRRPPAPMSDAVAWLQIFRLLRSLRPAIVHTHMAKAGFLGRLAAVAYNRTSGRRAPARLVHTYHGHVFEGYFGRSPTGLFVRMERVLARWTDAIVAISPTIEYELLSVYQIGSADRFHVIPLGFDLAPFAAIDDEFRLRARKELDLPRAAPVIIAVGRLTAIKRHHLFLEMASLLLQQRPDALFLVVGDGELRESLEEKARDLGVAGRVRFLGWRRDLCRIYGAADVLVLTSRNEGTPVTLIEAMAAGVACVSSAVGGVQDVIREPGIGTVVESANPRSLADAVVELLGSSRRAGLADRARQSVLSRFSLSRLVDDITSLYTRLLAA